MNSVTYLIGEPGVGKSTLMSSMLAKREPEEHLTPFAWLLTGEPTVIEIGGHRKHFSGTDALSMSVQPKVIDWLRRVGTKLEPPVLFVAEGDRLANDKFFQAVLDMGLELRIYHLVAPPEEIEKRRRQRESQLGKRQNESWLRGRRTKVTNLAARWQDYIQTVDVSGPAPLLRLEGKLGSDEETEAAEAHAEAVQQFVEELPAIGKKFGVEVVPWKM